jgi:uncharacterized protein YjbI with pentapeptide repeats
MSTITLRDTVHSIEANDANLSFSKFDDVRLAESTFNQVALADSRFEDVFLDGSSFNRVSLVNVRITEGNYDGMTIDGIPVRALLETYRATRGAGERAAAV